MAGYSDDVWKALREYYETSPKHITWKPCCEHVGELLKTPVPDPSVVARKANKEGWKKRRLTNKQPPKNASRQEVGNDQPPTSANQDGVTVCEPTTTTDNRVVYEVVGGRHDDISGVLSEKPIKEGLAQVSRVVKENETAQKKIIIKHRNIAAALAGMIESVIQTTVDAYKAYGDLVKPDDDAEDGVKDDDWDSDNQKKLILLKMEMASGTADLVETLSKAHERVAKIELAVWGIGPDDMKEGQAAARLAVVEGGKAKLAAGAAQMAKQKEAMKARLNGLEVRSENSERPDPVLRQRDNGSSHNDEAVGNDSEQQ